MKIFEAPRSDLHLTVRRRGADGLACLMNKMTYKSVSRKEQEPQRFSFSKMVEWDCIAER